MDSKSCYGLTGFQAFAGIASFERFFVFVFSKIGLETRLYLPATLSLLTKCRDRMNPFVIKELHNL